MDVAGLGGLWRRTLLVLADGRVDSATRVWWLQGPTMFVDLRLPGGMAQRGAASCLDDLGWEDCLVLARQEGFAGVLAKAGACFEWRRAIDFQPPLDRADAGSLEWHGEVLVERGRDVDYLEHWRRVAPAGRLRWGAVRLWDPQRQRDAYFVWCGGTAMFARNREPVRFGGATLHECVSGCDSLADARRLVDCEVSLGRWDGRDLLICESTLPYLVGQTLRVACSDSGLVTRTGSRGGMRRWDILSQEGTLPDQACAVFRGSGDGQAGQGG